MNGQAVAVRRRRFVWAVLTSTGSKFAAISVQLVALPIALHALGTDRYAAFLAIQAFLSWTSVFGFGLAPSLPKFIAAAGTSDDLTLQRDLIFGSIISVGTAAFALGIALILFGISIPPWNLISAGASVSHNELWRAYVTSVCLSTIMLVVVMQPSFRAGYQQLHYTNMWAMAANIWAAGMLLLFWKSNIGIVGFNLIVNGPIVPVLLLDFGLLVWRRPFLVRGWPNFSKVKDLILHQSLNALAVQVSFMLVTFLPTFIVSRFTSPSDTARFASVLQPLILGMNGMNIVFQPMISAFADAHSHGDIKWLKRNYYRLLAVTLAVGLTGFWVLAVFGPEIFRLWLRADIGIDSLLCIEFGVYFTFLLSCSYHYYVLAAVGGLSGVGRIFTLQGGAGMALGAILAVFYGSHGMVFGLCLGLAVAGAYYLPTKTVLFLGRQGGRGHEADITPEAEVSRIL